MVLTRLVVCSSDGPFVREYRSILVMAMLTACHMENLVAGDPLALRLRQAVKTAPAVDGWNRVTTITSWDPAKTAIIVCDMWDNHTCPAAATRVAEMAPRMNEVLLAARARGVFIIHCPSGTMNFYKDHPGRAVALAATPAETSRPLKRWCPVDPDREPPLPIDDSDGGCDCKRSWKPGDPLPWTRQIATLEIRDGDAITDSDEAYALMRQRGIENVIVMGVHTNMCILGRPFSIRQLVYQGLNVALMRDLTDTMYNPSMRPFVSHFTGTDLVVEHIEKYWCPTVTSTDLVDGEEFRFSDDTRPTVVLLLGETEYKTAETLPKFALEHLGKNFRVVTLFLNETSKTSFPGIETVRDADVVLISVRRRPLLPENLEVLREYVAAGKPVVGIRTASHAFHLRDTPAPSGLADWPDLDATVFGGNYSTHYRHDRQALVSPLASVRNHPLLAGVPKAEFPAGGGLYQTTPLNLKATELLQGRVEGVAQPEPVAWTFRRADGGASFYTSLGHPADFERPEFTTLLANAVAWAAKQPVPRSTLRAPARPPHEIQDNPLSPQQSLNLFTVPDDLMVETVLAEPTISQPVFMNFDDRGRLWIMEYRQYPEPAGLKLLSKDRWWRAVYDGVPAPPPYGVRGRDRISIHEDTDGDGSFDSHKVFVDGLNIATSFTQGRGGVFVTNPPYLLFYPDHNGDDVPDRDPEVLLSGFGLEDTHSVINSLRFGPDGWLYAAQGSTVSATVKHPQGNSEDGPSDKKGIFTQGQNIWRYHPETRRYEVFAEGGGNAFCVEFDSYGRLFSGHNGGNTRGFHYMQGASLQKGFSKHGSLSNPYAFGYFPAMEHGDSARFTHGILRYEGTGLPDRYLGTLIGINPIARHVVVSEMTPVGSTYRTRDLHLAIESADDWFRPVDVKDGPDGAIYVADWYDSQLSHTANYQGGMDRSRGRIYRIKAHSTSHLRSGSRPQSARHDTLISDPVTTLAHPNRWHRQTALRIIGDRRDKALVPALLGRIRMNQPVGTVDALWALALCGGLDSATIPELLAHPNPQVRLWTVRLLADDGSLPDNLIARISELARSETSIEARCQYAASAKRLPPEQALPLIVALATHEDDAADPRLPLLLWWAWERAITADPTVALRLLDDPAFWQMPLVQQQLLARLMRRFAVTGRREDLATCAMLLERAPDAESTNILMGGFEEAFRGRSLTGVPPRLVEALVNAGGGSLALRVRQGDNQALTESLSMITNENAETATRTEMIALLGEAPHPPAVGPLLEILTTTRDETVKMAVLTTLQAYNDPRIAPAVLTLYHEWGHDLRALAQSLLASRKASALALLGEVEAGRVDATSLLEETIRTIMLHRDDHISVIVKKYWENIDGGPTADMQEQFERGLAALGDQRGDPSAGKPLYMQLCGKCHSLHDLGGQIGPDLTVYDRNDVRHMLVNIINPSAEIREGFEGVTATLDDGRVVSGYLVEQDPSVLVMRTVDGQTISIRRDTIDEFLARRKSLMPENLLSQLSAIQIRDLFAYLRTSQPLP